MVIAAFILFFFSVIQLLVALVNLLWHQPLKSDRNDFSGLVSVLIPARDEEKNIGNILSDLHHQRYPEIEVLVYDDQSADHTAEVVSKWSIRDKRIRLIPSEDLPDGWLGKTFACHRLATEAKGVYYLFLDADVRISGDIIHQTVAMASEKQLGLLSVFPCQIMKTPGEWSSVPLMHYILLTLLPLILVRKSGFSSLSAANGQFMLFDASTYRAFRPHKKMKSDKVEDISIARWFKKSGLGIACLTGKSDIRCRMYSGYRESVNGFAKNLTAFFGNSFILAFTFWVITTLGWIVVFSVLGWKTGFLYLFVLLSTRVLVSLAAKQGVIRNLIFWIPQQITFGIILYKSLLYRINHQYQWKGRNIR